jgi:flagellar biosynthesis/type III secretory pathway M-ring protein FliF/YscJ
MNLSLPLIIACIVIVLVLIIFPLIVSYRAENPKNEEKNKQKELSEWEKIKKYGNEINKKTRKK